MEEEFDSKQVIVDISGAEEKSNGVFDGIEKLGSGSYSFSKYLRVDPAATSTSSIPVAQFTGSSTTEIPKLDPVMAQKVNEEAIDSRQRAPARSAFSKPKSRLVEPPIPGNWKMANERASTTVSPSSRSATKTPKASPPITPKTPLMASPRDQDDDDDVYVTGVLQAHQNEKPAKKVKVMFLIECGVFICVILLLVLSFTVDKLENCLIWSLQLWKWCVLVLVIFCGRLYSGWFTDLVVLLIEQNFLLKKNVLYFVYSLQKSVRVFIWLGLILLTWGLLINRVHRSRNVARILNHITRALASTLIGAGLWILKTLFVKILASSYHVKRFFDKIQESIFHQYVLQTLSGPPLMEYAESISSARTSGRLSFKSSMNKGGEANKEDVINVQKLQKMKREKVSAWTMGRLIKVIRKSGLSTLSDVLEASEDADERSEQGKKTITCEWEAQNAANTIFSNVAKHGHKYIKEEDLLRFMKKDEVDNVLPLFEGAVETGRIKKKSFRNWVVNVYTERKFLAHSLNDTKTAIEELNKLVTGILLIVLAIVWLLLMGLATTELLLFISSQLLLAVFMFGNSAKTVFEAIIFVFVMHPFDVGDRCVIDGVQVVVEEMNILTTVFLRYDNEKIFYPNSILATKAISNFNRSPEMGDSVEFDVDVSTSIDNILALKAKIKTYLESKPQHWRASHSVGVRDIEDVNKMKMSLYVMHTMNFQNYQEKTERRSNLVFELNKMFQELGIKYHLLPQEVVVRYVGSASPPTTTVTRL